MNNRKPPMSAPATQHTQATKCATCSHCFDATLDHCRQFEQESAEHNGLLIVLSCNGYNVVSAGKELVMA